MLVSSASPWHENLGGSRGQCHRGAQLNMLIVKTEWRSVLKEAGAVLEGLLGALVAFGIDI